MAKFVGGLVAGIVGTTLLFVIVVGVPKSPQLGPASMRPMRPPAAVPSAECLTTGKVPRGARASAAVDPDR